MKKISKIAFLTIVAVTTIAVGTALVKRHTNAQPRVEVKDTLGERLCQNCTG